MARVSVIETLRSLIGESPNHSFYECRQCGTNLDTESDSCPECGASEIAQFNF